MRHIAANFLTLLVLGMIGLYAAVEWGRSEYRSDGPLAEPLVFTVERGARLTSVADRLQDDGAITNSTIFGLGARYSELADDLKFGEYEIPAGASMEEIMALLASGRGIDYKVTIPEGFSTFQVIARLNAVEDLEGEVTISPAEGAIAPDTYSYQRGDSRDSVLQKMMDRQVEILAEEWDLRQADLPYETPEEALIMASIIEKETGVGSERDVVAAVFVNRLRQGMKLQTDPTVIYGLTLGRESLGRGLRRSELARRTPYNTYIIPALPPTPIANPGRAAINAAMNPAESSYLFFVADGTGGHAFAETLVEHNANVRKWRQIEAERRAAAEAAEAEAAAAEDNAN
ncbi:MAG: endolytic transglycosylase MltG [Pseudomonadota bacterium]